MTKEVTFFLCKHCGNLVEMINDTGVPLICCGDEMTQLAANTVDASTEKHKPVVTVDGTNVNVSIGSVDHPMIDAHFIQWIYLATKHGGQRRDLLPGMRPEATFVVVADEAVAAYAYCNIHGLWKTDL